MKTNELLTSHKVDRLVGWATVQHGFLSFARGFQLTVNLTEQVRQLDARVRLPGTWSCTSAPQSAKARFNRKGEPVGFGDPAQQIAREQGRREMGRRCMVRV